MSEVTVTVDTDDDGVRTSYDATQKEATLLRCGLCWRYFYMTHQKAICIVCRREFAL